MKRPLIALISLAFALPALAQEPLVVKRLNGMNLEVEELGVPQASSDKVDLRGVPAVKITNHSQEIASCQFHALPEETVMTAAPAMSISPNEQAVAGCPASIRAVVRLPCWCASRRAYSFGWQ